jgi:mRNA interferase YafQ
MRTPNFTKQFDRDVKRMRKRKKDLDKLKLTLAILIAEQQLEPRYFDHALGGNYKNRRECHIEPDWLLIYKLAGNEIFFERTGAHADLFK